MTTKLSGAQVQSMRLRMVGHCGEGGGALLRRRTYRSQPVGSVWLLDAVLPVGDRVIPLLSSVTAESC